MIRLLLFISLFILTERFCHKQTQGFALNKILSKQTEIKPSQNASSEVAEIVNQPFSFLGKGGQSYAFLSQDGKFVLKFFKQHHARFWKRVSKLPLPSFLDKRRKELCEKHAYQSSEMVESFKIANAEMKEQTGLLYLHLDRTDHFENPLTLIDSLGIAHQIDLDQVDFALQKRADPAYDKLRVLINEQQLEEAKQCLDSLILLSIQREAKGISDRDANIRRNFGFIGTQAIEFDLGSYTKNSPQAKDSEKERKKFQRWLNKHCPELGEYFALKIENPPLMSR